MCYGSIGWSKLIDSILGSTSFDNFSQKIRDKITVLLVSEIKTLIRKLDA
jgi:hypothetical protein